jgi:hypothetical protein
MVLVGIWAVTDGRDLRVFKVEDSYRVLLVKVNGLCGNVCIRVVL